MPRRVIAYIDGFNLYHALADLGEPSLKWVNLWSLSQSLSRREEQLVGVKYFSAFATWLPGPYARHRQYVRALEAVGVRPIIGRFKEKPRRCARCGASWIAHEEKETDVNIAIHLVQDTLTDQFDRAIIVSADSDLAPALKLAKSHAPPKEIFVAAPPGRFAHARDLHPRLEITKGRIAKHLLGATIRNSAGAIIATRPVEYDPNSSS
jgi:NYN domain-containing protein